MRVLVTDGTYKHALAAVRSLGRRNWTVYVGAARRLAQAFCSRYCAGRLVYPDPRDEHRFAEAVSSFAQAHAVNVVLPIGYQANVALSRCKATLAPHVGLPVADWEVMQIGCDKGKTIAWAQRIGIPMPTVYPSARDVDRFPVVVKKTRESGGVRYANSREELARVDLASAVIEEYIPGAGYGFFGLFDHGRCRALFMHRRVREYPVTGGASTAAESVSEPELRTLGLTLLESLRWHGVAMVECKKDRRDGKFKLMEINAKFWGSLDLAVACGVDFPYLAARLAAGESVPETLTYPIGRRFRWLFPDDLLHVLARPRSCGAVVADLINGRTQGNFSWSDPKPNLFQAAASAPLILSRIVRGTLRRPHGFPEVGA